MKRYSMAQARQRFTEVLDTAERGQPVVIERRGVRFVVEAQPRRRQRRPRPKPIIEHVDPDVAAGNWTWIWNADGLRFKSRRQAR